MGNRNELEVFQRGRRMEFIFHERPSDSPFVQRIWRTQSERAGSFISTAVGQWEMVVTRHNGTSTVTVRGPETEATRADSPADAEFFGIVFTPGTFMPHLLPGDVLDRNDATLPAATSQSFWLQGTVWQFPDYENADTFVARLVQQGLLEHDPVVDAVLQNRPAEVSLRTVQRRFRRATGVTHSTFAQIERADEAVTLLEQGVSIADAVYRVGYADQPHLTRSLKRFIGQTPGQIARRDSRE